jgi:ankyrin repeat protein
MVQLLLWKGVDVSGKDERSQTALHATARRLYFNYGKHDVTIARILLKAGADIEAADEHGETALIKAAAGRRTHLVKALLRNGANVYARDHCQSTALHAAADDDKGRRRSDAEMYSTLQVLLDAGADIDAEDGLQNTVLSNACIRRRRGLASFLVERGVMFTPRGVPGEDFFLTLFLKETNRNGCDDQPLSPIAETWSIDGQDSFDEE